MDLQWLYGPSLTVLKAVIIMGLGYIMAQITKKYCTRALSRIAIDPLIINAMSKTIFYLIIFIALIMAGQIFNINITAILATAGVFGIAVGLAAQTSLSNIISGIFLMIEKPFKYNEIIQIDGIEGKVKTINFFCVLLQTADNKIVRIPHEKLLKTIIIKKD